MSDRSYCHSELHAHEGTGGHIAPTVAAAGLTVNERVERLRAAFAGTRPEILVADWANFGNEWGQGGGFDNKVVFEKYT